MNYTPVTIDLIIYLCIYWYYRTYFIIVILLQLFQLVSSQSVLLNSSLNDQHIVRRGENITFQCTTTGSSILAWSSNEYIGDRIEFLNVHTIGTIVTPNQYTSAKLIDVYTDQNGQAVIVSLLSSIVQRAISQSSVTCHHVGSGRTKTITFQLSSKFEVVYANDLDECMRSFTMSCLCF